MSDDIRSFAERPGRGHIDNIIWATRRPRPPRRVGDEVRGCF